MSTTIKVRGGQVTAVWEDRFRPILESLGVMEVTRGSNVEFEPETGDWVATLPSGQEIARGKERNQVIEQEVAYLEERI